MKDGLLNSKAFEEELQCRNLLEYEHKVVTRILDALQMNAGDVKMNLAECRQETGAPGFTADWASNAFAWNDFPNLVVHNRIPFDMVKFFHLKDRSKAKMWKVYVDTAVGNTLLVFRCPKTRKEWALECGSADYLVGEAAIVFRIPDAKDRLFVLQQFRHYLEAVRDG